MNIYEEAAHRSLGAISDPELRTGVGRLFAEAQQMVDEGEVGLVVLAARRLPCLYQLLVQAGMPPIKGSLVISDRFLDAGEKLEQTPASVLLLDDTVVVGTTLIRLHDDLLRNGTSAVICRTVCLDIDQKAEYLLESANFHALYSRNSNQVQEFSHEVAVALFAQQVPFFSDFPITRPVDIPVDAWTAYLGNSDWHVADVTGPLLSSDMVRTYAQIPTQETTERLLSRVPPQASALLDNFKIRSYVRKLTEGVRVVFVPIAMVAPCKPSVLDEALEAIASNLPDASAEFAVDWRHWSPVAKHRLTQIYLSICVLAEMWPNIGRASADLFENSVLTEALEQLPLSLYFAGHTEAVLSVFDALGETYQSTEADRFQQPARIRLDQPARSELLYKHAVQEVLWEARELLARTGYPEQPSQGQLTKIGLIFAHAISSIFGFVNRKYELRQRAEIKSLSSRAAYDELFGDGSRRFLNQGFTMRELMAALAPDHTTGSPWARSLLSLGIDTGNDLGIIVPVTQYDVIRDIAYRSYRLGETAQLAEWPLPNAIRSGRFDLLSSSVKSGFPIFPRMESIDFRGVRRTKSTLDTLRLAVLDAVPGNVVLHFNGTVTDVTGDSFDVELISPLEDDHRVARMRSAQLTNIDRRRLKPGAMFTWTVFSRERGGAKDNISRIRMRSVEPLDTERLYRDAKALVYLTQVPDETSL